MIHPLPFDSSLFGYPVGKFVVQEPWNEKDFLLQAEGFELVYIFSQDPIQLQTEKIRLVDVKLTFCKYLTAYSPNDPDIIPFSEGLTEEILDLALASGIHSRFHTDPGFAHGEFEKLYTCWIENALSKGEVWVTKKGEGMVTCALSGNKAQIGLIAVDKNQRGKGWGRKLVWAAENFAFLHGESLMIIGTQEANLPAVSLYQSLGYQLQERAYVFHFRP